MIYSILFYTLCSARIVNNIRFYKEVYKNVVTQLIKKLRSILALADLKKVLDYRNIVFPLAYFRDDYP